MFLEINHSASSVSFDTKSCFENSPSVREELSPIDLYWKNIQVMNKLMGGVVENPILGLLILLGSVSAVESYFRTLICKIIVIDKEAEKKCLNHSLAYGAVLTSIQHSKKIEDVAEALLEGCSFASKKNILESLKNFIGINKGQLPNELTSTLEDFEKVCHLRHCAVHRFGVLGTKNAISLDFETHSVEVGNSLQIGVDEIDNIVAICTNVIKLTNNYLFDFLIKRMVKSNHFNWKWDLRSDKTQFLKYYNLFYSDHFSNNERYKAKQIYNQFRRAEGNV